MAIQTPEVEATDETVPWTDYLIPLPQEIAVTDTVRVSPDQVGFVTPSDASAMVAEAVDELRAAYRAKSGCGPTGTSFPRTSAPTVATMAPSTT